MYMIQYFLIVQFAAIVMSLPFVVPTLILADHIDYRKLTTVITENVVVQISKKSVTANIATDRWFMNVSNCSAGDKQIKLTIRLDDEDKTVVYSSGFLSSNDSYVMDTYSTEGLEKKQHKAYMAIESVKDGKLVLEEEYPIQIKAFTSRNLF